jgi:hypothetical protein
MIRSKEIKSEIVIDITGPKGNAYYLLALAENLAKQLGIDPIAIIDEMESGNYDNLIQTFDKWFGDYVVLEV